MVDSITVQVSQKNLSKHYLNDATSDVIFLCNDNGEMDERIPAHKLILACCSDVFQVMFFGSLPENSEIKLPDVSARGFKQFLQVLYMEEATFTHDCIEEIFYLARKYDVIDCMDACVKFFKQNLTIEKLFAGYEFALNNELLDLQEFLAEQIYCRRSELIASPCFLSSSKVMLSNLLNIKRFKSEGKLILSACLAWAENDCKLKGLEPMKMRNKRIALEDILHLIEFGSMTRSDILQCTKDYHDLFTLHDMDKLQNIIAVRVPTNDFNDNWIIFETIESKLHLRPANIFSVKFHTNKQFLLNEIAFNIDWHNTNLDKVSFTLSISKISLNYENEMQSVISLVQFFSCPRATDHVRLFDGVIIEPDIMYKMEIIPEDEVFVYQCLRTYNYEQCPLYGTFDTKKSHSIRIDFDGPNFIFINVKSL